MPNARLINFGGAGLRTPSTRCFRVCHSFRTPARRCDGVSTIVDAGFAVFILAILLGVGEKETL